MIRSAWVALNAAIATILLGVPILVLAALGVRTGFYEWAGRTWAKWLIRRSNTPVHVEGLEHVRPDGPQVLASNHQSWYDVFALAAVVPKRYRFIAKKELERIPLFGPAWKAAGHISVDREDRRSAIQSLDLAGQIIREDNSAVLIFPEGTRSWDGRLLPFKKGAFMLALRTGVDIVPIAVLGSREILPKGEWRIRPGPIIVRFGEPIRVRGRSDAERDRLVEDVRARIQELLDRPAPILSVHEHDG